MTLKPSVKWAQRRDIVYITITVEDISEEKINLEEKKLSFEGIGGAGRNRYAFEVELFGEINPKNSKQKVSPRECVLVLAKKDTDKPFWSRLTSQKWPFVHTDFARWKDEDDSSDDEMYKDNDFESMMSNLNPKAEDMANDADEEDSDDEEMPDLEESK